MSFIGAGEMADLFEAHPVSFEEISSQLKEVGIAVSSTLKRKADRPTLNNYLDVTRKLFNLDKE